MPLTSCLRLFDSFLWSCQTAWTGTLGQTQWWVHLEWFYRLWPQKQNSGTVANSSESDKILDLNMFYWGFFHMELTLLSLKLTYDDIFCSYASVLKATLVDIIRMYSSRTSFDFIHHNHSVLIHYFIFFFWNIKICPILGKLQTVKVRDIGFTPNCIICHPNLNSLKNIIHKVEYGVIMIIPIFSTENDFHILNI